MKKDAKDWSEDDLQELISLGVQEGLELDYKQCDALQKSDSRKNEVSKDVAAFANSAGGVIVYGVKENGHFPVQLDIGFDPSEISKEWLEQVINSRIHRRIEGVRVNQVSLPKAAPGRVAYVVVVPQSTRAPHQSADKKFYKRFNFESVPMEEYEVRDVGQRSTSPDLELNFCFGKAGDKVALQMEPNGEYQTIELAASVTNNSSTPAEYAVVHLLIDKRIALDQPGHDVRLNDDGGQPKLNDIPRPMRKLTILWGRDRGLPIFSGVTATVPSPALRIRLPVNVDLMLLQYTVATGGMTTKEGAALVTVKDGVAALQPLKVSPDPA
jgi:hypothetical protein